MPLPTLIDFPPGKFGKDVWSFSHARDHDEIAQRIQAISGINLPIYQLDPMVFTTDSVFFERNQQMHNDFNATLGIAGSDLSSIDFKDKSQVQFWLLVHFNEHRNARIALGI